MASPVRVCHFTASRGLGRGEVYVDLANAMAQSDLPIEVGIMAPADPLFRERLDPGVRLIQYGSRNTRHNPFLWKELAGLVREFSPDIVHTHFAKATSIYRGLNYFLRNPFVATKHNPRKGAVYEKTENVISVSRVVQDSVKTGKSFLVYNGLTPETPAARISTENSKLKLLCVGRLDPIKGYDQLIRMLMRMNLPWELTILGDGEQRSTLGALVKESGLSDRVFLPGFTHDIPQQMADCDVCIFSSLSEGCSIAMLEAMHYAPLVLSTRTGLAMELFPDWLLWNLAEPKTLITALQDHQARRSRFKKWVTPLLPGFHMDQVVSQHLALYRTIISARTSGNES